MRKVFVLAIIAVFMLSMFMSISADTVPLKNGDFNIKHSVITKNDEYCEINVTTPYFENFTGSDDLNRIIRNIVADAIGAVRATGIELKEFGRKTALNISYDYSKYDNLISTQIITYTYLGGAHGSTVITPITANTVTGEKYSFKDLFIKEEGIDYVERHIIDNIKKDPDWYFEDYEKTITDKNGDFEFFLEGKNLVVFFGQYEIAPYAGGIRYFEINAATLKDFLKKEIYDSLNTGKEKGNIIYNGIDTNSNLGVLKNNDNYLVPLRVIAETLGYKVDWNKEDGAIVAGGLIKEGSAEYWKDGKEPIEMIMPVVINGVTYVPIDYFTVVLEENVGFDIKGNDLEKVMIYNKEGFENNFDKQIVDFSSPSSGKAAVEMYAEAAKNRNGAIQYALLSDEVRENKYGDLSGLYFVTGVSSPWIDSYEISEVNENDYIIEFTLKTSVPTDFIKESFKISVDEKYEYWEITSIE